jgi:hydrogenase maturation protease
VKTTRVFGLRNILLGVDVVGVHALERMQLSYHFPGRLHVLDGGTFGLHQLPYIEDADRLLPVDVVQVDEALRTVLRLDSEEIPAFPVVKRSPHQQEAGS